MALTKTDFRRKEITLQLLDKTDDTPTMWESLIVRLDSKAAYWDRELEELLQEREGLLLDAEPGIAGAAKRLAKIDEEIARSRKERPGA
jgi:hypothetical protein